MSAPSIPVNLLCRNVGNGSVELQWTASSGAVSYNVYLCTTLGGTYIQANRAPIIGTTVRLPNLTFGLTVYFKVTAVNAGGEESALSSVSQDAVCNPGVCTLEFTGLVGDVIPAGAMFVAPVAGRLVTFVVTAGGVCA